MQKDTQIFLAGTDYSGISGSELTRVIIGKGADARGARRADARAAFLAAFDIDIDNMSHREVVPGV